jgi:two-component system sensor histidine kinase/response regulator
VIEPTASGRILVVDDTEVNRILLQEMLELEGYQVILADDGAEALRAASREDPDLVLLDVNMPGMNGLEVCRRLRADSQGTSLPIILVTALADRQHRLDGIGAGANDYLTKPVDRPDLLLRVKNALRLRRLHREVAEQYARLQQLETLRDNLVHMLVHDLRSPLTGITVYLQMARERVAELGDAQLLDDFESLNASVVQLTDMVGDVLDVSRLEANAMPLRPSEIDLRTLATEAVSSLGRARHASVIQRQPDSPVLLIVDPGLIRRVIANLVGNALKFAPRESEVRVEIIRGEAAACVRVSDSGPGIAPEYHAHIFEKFGDAGANGKPKVRSSGLGLTFCKLAVEAHGGRIGVESAVGAGSTFWVMLPTLQHSGLGSQSMA